MNNGLTVVEVSSDKVVIEAPKAKHLVSVYRTDFQNVWQVWPAYKTGWIQRHEIRDTTFFSKYIISIFHWIESN